MPSFTPVSSLFRSVVLGQVDQVTFSGAGAGFRVANRGATDLWVRVDGVDPAASSDENHLIRAGEDRVIGDPSGNREIRLTAGATCLYGVELTA